MNILIVEDERVAARRLERMIREILGEKVSSITIRESLGKSEAFLGGNRIDLLLLDLNLSGRDGFDLLKSVTAYPFQTIVVSANTDQALRAFEYGVIDFVPKPYDRERLVRALARLERRPEPADTGAAAAQLSVRHFGTLILVPVEDVLYFRGAGDYVEIHLRDKRMELHSKSLESLERILPAYFVRVHKSYLVDVRYVKQVLVHGGGRYELDMGEQLRIPLSRSRYKEIERILARAR